MDQLNLQSVATTFIEDVIFSFGICAVFTIDVNRKWRGVIEKTLQALNISVSPLSQVNHKGMIAEKCHNVLKNTEAIFGQDRGTHFTYWKPETSQYTWNIPPIYYIYITHCVTDVGKEFNLHYMSRLTQLLLFKRTRIKYYLNTSEMYLIINYYLYQHFKL